MALTVDFGAKTIGGGSSTIALPGPAAITGNIATFNYAGLTGDAKYTPTISSPAGVWTGTTIKLLDTGGVTAGAASIDVRVVNTLGPNPSTQYGGPVTGTLAP